ncbi:cob(I)yrinic acid a,c-diamide adenosyltransferase [Candidatus Woesearchaeota archaeon]|nr:cob(I)yrinic acid a,c-diamide adenosyltransferase [Candidatus Woesearchaeota archaeon]
MTLYYTKAGDKGETGFFGGRLKKSDQRFSAIGDVDETNAALGVALAHCDDGQVRQAILKAQNLLFTVGAELAGTAKVHVTAEHVTELEKTIDRFAELIKPQTTFLLPNGTKAASFLHLARAVCRRAERSAVVLNEKTPLNPELLRYLNRMSSLLHVLARYENRKITESAPTY